MIDSARETLISLADVPANLPNRRGGKRPHVSCIYLWCQCGCKGIKLEVLQVGGTKCTSLEALQRFYERLSAVASGEAPPVRTVKQRERAAAKANDELAKAGWRTFLDAMVGGFQSTGTPQRECNCKLTNFHRWWKPLRHWSQSTPLVTLLN